MNIHVKNRMRTRKEKFVDRMTRQYGHNYLDKIN